MFWLASSVLRTHATMFYINSECAVQAESQYETDTYTHCFDMCGTMDLV
jgi:hypothetical protein